MGSDDRQHDGEDRQQRDHADADDDDVDDVADQPRAGSGECHRPARARPPAQVACQPARLIASWATPSASVDRRQDRLTTTVPAIRSWKPRRRLSTKIQMKPR